MIHRRSIPALALLLLALPIAVLAGGPKGRDVILFIGDGMGPGVIEATDRYLFGASASGKLGSMVFEDPKIFPLHAMVGTAASDVPVTDSAAAATAMATGRKVNKGTLSTARPGDGQPLPTILEAMRDDGCSVGLVTTSFITDATPAAFASHSDSRRKRALIAEEYLKSSRPDVLMGGGDPSLTPAALKEAGYEVIPARKTALAAFDTEKAYRVAILAGDDRLEYVEDRGPEVPDLPQLTRAALAVLDNNPKCLFLMVEGGRIDHGAHANELPKVIAEVEEFSRAVAVGLEWAKTRPQALIAVTADHDTGGLVPEPGAPNRKGELPMALFSTMEHTATEVDFFATGGGRLPDHIENTGIYDFMKGYVTGTR